MTQPVTDGLTAWPRIHTGETPSNLGEGNHEVPRRVRKLLDIGDVAGAAKILGHPHRVTGEVVHGEHRGRELGYPTANLCKRTAEQVPVCGGIYAGWMIRPRLDEYDLDHTLPVAISIGTNPTFAGTQRNVEAYVLDRNDLDLYGETVVVEFIERLRATEKFESVKRLIAQIAEDVERCRQVLSSNVMS